jgi:O-antigen ligase
VLNGTRTVSEVTRATGPVIDPNIFAGYLLLVIPLAIAVGLALRPRWVLPATVLATVMWGTALAASLSRSGWLGLLIGFAVLAVFMRRRRWGLAVIAAGLIAAVVLGGLVGPVAQRLDNQQPGGPFDELASRAQVWAGAFGVWEQHPLFGVGIANFGNYYDQEGGGQEVIGHAHNIFLNMAAERGILGLLTFVNVIAVLFWTLRRGLAAAHNPVERAAVAGLIATLAGYFVHSMLEVSYYDYKVLLLFWLLVGIAAALPILCHKNAAPAIV